MRKTLLISALIFALRPATVQAADPNLYGIPLPPPIPPGTPAPYELPNGDLGIPLELQPPLTELLLWTKEFPQVCADIMEARENHAGKILANREDEHTAELEAVEAKLPRWWVWPATILGAAAVGYAAGKLLP